MDLDGAFGDSVLNVEDRGNIGTRGEPGRATRAQNLAPVLGLSRRARL